MRSKRFRRGGLHPLTRAIDAAIDSRRVTGQTVTTGNIASDLVSVVPGPLMITEFERLVAPRVRARMKARGDIVVDDMTWERKVDAEITDAEYAGYANIVGTNLDRITRRAKAVFEINKFLSKQATKLGRPVTLGEFEPQIEAIYAKHGLPPM